MKYGLKEKNKKKKIMKKNLLILGLILMYSISFIGQEKSEEKTEEKTEEKKEKKSEEKTIADLTESSKKIEGLFTIYQDTINGKLKMVVSKNQFEKEFIYFSQIADGVVEAGRFRGSYQSEAIFQIKRYFDKIEFVAPNTNFYFDPSSPTFEFKRCKY